MSSKTTSREDLVRMLTLLSYFTAHRERTVFEAARDLGRDHVSLMADLERLRWCGMPEESSADLVELTASYQKVTIANAHGLDRPLRLTAPEAAMLLLTLESLENYPGLADVTAIRSAAAKIRAISGRLAEGIADLTPEEDLLESGTLALVLEAYKTDRRLAFDYASASTDEISRREASIASVFSDQGEAYIIGWVDELEAHRTFRVDRMSQVVVLDEKTDPHLAEIRLDPENPFSFPRTTEVAELLVRQESTWLADYYPLKLGAAQDDWVSATLPYGSEDWLVRFALGNADRLRIVAPAGAAATVADRANAALRAYDVSDSSE